MTIKSSVRKFRPPGNLSHTARVNNATVGLSTRTVAELQSKIREFLALPVVRRSETTIPAKDNNCNQVGVWMIRPSSGGKVEVKGKTNTSAWLPGKVVDADLPSVLSALPREILRQRA